MAIDHMTQKKVWIVSMGFVIDTIFFDFDGATLTEGPFDVAKAIDAGLRNIVSSFGATLSKSQAHKLKDLADHTGVSSVVIAFDRDSAGVMGAEKAVKFLTSLGLKTRIFDWEISVGERNGRPMHITENTSISL